MDTHTATIRWGDGSGPTVAAVDGSNTSGTASGSHLYAGPGIHIVTVEVEDKDGGTATAKYEYAVIYDPDAGFGTGGGWIDSPPGAYAPDPARTGKASFEFAAKYQKEQPIPAGSTRVQFPDGGVDFISTSYEWLVIDGAKAQLEGAGSVNGVPGYGFWLSAIDGERKGPDFPDTFRVRIWRLDSGAVLYDNQQGDANTAAPTTALGGGSIVIHR
jgi:hypothetical protein